MNQNTYWSRWWRERASRRRVLAAGGLAATGVAGLALVGCGDDDDGGNGEKPTEDKGSQLTPVSATPDPNKPVAGGTLRVLGTIGSIIDPHRTNTPTESIDIWGRVGNFLIRNTTKDPIGFPEADLAASLPEVPGDGTVLIFKIRPEAKWQNRAPVSGRAVTAEDVKLTFERIKDPAVKSPRAGNYGNVESITVVDERTLQFKLKAPQADLLSIMADQYDFVLPKEISSRGLDAVKTAADVIGSGPYELASFEAGQKFSLKRRADGYWRPNTAWLDGYEYTHQTDPQQLTNALRAGQADAVGLSTVDHVKAFENDKGYTIVKAPTSTRECLLINHGKERYKDPRIRLALSRAINRKQVYDTVFGGAGIVGGPMTPAGPAWVLPDAELKKLPGYGDRATEIKEAKDLLAAAGLGTGFEETVLTVTAFNTEQVHEVVVSNLADVGIKVKTENVGTDFAANFLPREVQRQYNLATTLFLSGAYPDAQLLLYHHSDTKTKGTRNYGDFASKELDVKLEKQSTMYDAKARQALVWEIQRDLINAPGPAWMGSRMVFGVYNSRVRNVAAFPFAAGYWGAENVWIKS
ncbi:MAG: ABC transporter substrate-binding protein [Dehalococcoidia bacterium]|nr:ABC transporter substrate-binding protein [Dehalococcoidia bacterium]